MDYDTEVEKDAFDFLLEIEDDIKAAIIAEEDDVSEIQCDESGYGEIRDAFHEQVTDRSYDIEDAAYVIANCSEAETDSGIWEGQDMQGAMQACAAYSYSNDVWAKVVEVYEGLYDEFEPSWIVVDSTGEELETFTDEEAAQEYCDDEENEEAFEVKEGRGNVDELWQDYKDENIESEIETGGSDELAVLRQWVRLSKKASTWGGYPFGSVYIDARCGTGYSMPDVKDFYDFDVIARRKLPSMVGKYGDAINDRIEELEGITRKPYIVTVDLETDTEREIIDGLHEIAGKIQDGYETGYGWMFRNRGKG